MSACGRVGVQKVLEQRISWQLQNKAADEGTKCTRWRTMKKKRASDQARAAEEAAGWLLTAGVLDDMFIFSLKVDIVS